MSVTGLFLLLFLLVHVTVNLTSLFGAETFNRAAHFMSTHPFILVMVPVLASGLGIHIVYALWLSFSNLKARGTKRYAVPQKGTATSWAAKNMLVLGLLIAGGLTLHLFHFWSQMQLRAFTGGVEADPYSLLVYQFSHVHVVIVYLVWITSLWFHLTHGFWSAFHSLGLNNNLWIRRWQTLAYVYATLIALGFSSIPLYFFFKQVNLL